MPVHNLISIVLEPHTTPPSSFISCAREECSRPITKMFTEILINFFSCNENSFVGVCTSNNEIFFVSHLHKKMIFVFDWNHARSSTWMSWRLVMENFELTLRTGLSFEIFLFFLPLFVDNKKRVEYGEKSLTKVSIPVDTRCESTAFNKAPILFSLATKPVGWCHRIEFRLVIWMWSRWTQHPSRSAIIL